MPQPAPRGAMRAQGAGSQRNGPRGFQDDIPAPLHREARAGHVQWGKESTSTPVLTRDRPRLSHGSSSWEGAFKNACGQKWAGTPTWGTTPASQEGPTCVRNSWPRRTGSPATDLLSPTDPVAREPTDRASSILRGRSSHPWAGTAVDGLAGRIPEADVNPPCSVGPVLYPDLYP